MRTYLRENDGYSFTQKREMKKEIKSKVKKYIKK